MNGNIMITGDLIRIDLAPGLRQSLRIGIKLQIPQYIRDISIYEVVFTDLVGTLTLLAKDKELPIGPITSTQDLRFFPGEMKLELLTWIDDRIIERLEEIRRAGKGHLIFRIQSSQLSSTVWIIRGNSSVEGPIACRIVFNNMEYRLVRDDWLNQMQAVGYRKFRIYEVPDFSMPTEWNVIQHLDKAWNDLSYGNPDDAMQECRKALEGIKKVAKEKGLTVSAQRNGNETEVIDFNKLVGSDTLGDTLDKMFTAAYGFMTPGQHHGKAIRHEDGEYAVLATHALLNYISRVIERS
ncbi:MAG: hypothetical protein M1442_00240 [Candidatus Thermoplasmatota archaeon]|jgi:hypothetical protein|nr:hypothetical protein [Candidatus Thermoplasmatota archaeon]